MPGIFPSGEPCLNKLITFISNSGLTPGHMIWHRARTTSQPFRCSVSLPQVRPLLLLYSVTRNTGPYTVLIAPEVTATHAVEQDLETATAMQGRHTNKLLLGDVLCGACQRYPLLNI